MAAETLSSRYSPVSIKVTSSLTLRRWTPHDVASLAHHANNRLVWINLRDAFPHPYTTSDAKWWIDNGPADQLCISYNGAAVGGIGYTPKADIERCTAEVGYWLGEDLWGKGLATKALVVACEWAFEQEH